MSPAIVAIEALGAGGDGIAGLDGGQVFVPGALPGDRVEIAPEGKAGGEGRQARLLRVLEPGPDRVAPPCRHATRCGGCALQHMAPAPLSDWKRQTVVVALGHRGFGAPPVGAIVPAAPGRRRRVAWTARTDRRGALLFGYHARRSRELVDIAMCPLLEPALEALLRPLRDLLRGLMPPRGEARVAATVTDGGVDLLIDLPGRPDSRAFERMASFADTHDLARLLLRQDGMPVPVATRRPPVLDWPHLAVEPPPGGFLQADRVIEREMQRLVGDLAAGAARVADLYCGCGTLTAALDPASEVLALDSDAEAVAALKAAVNRVPGRRVTALARDLNRRPLMANELAGFDLVVLDPPAAGARVQAAELAASRVPAIGYVSCEPATFARDARMLADGGYDLVSVTPLDQFHWAADIELFAVFRRT
ncbi:MAG: hypothetical protein VYB54_09265 [Pseudomonadota bacterium]|nr:hypothetical protein [Pseudomonadota bacterium]